MKKGISTILEDLNKDGISVLEGWIDSNSLADMQTAFEGILKKPRFNTTNGYQQNEKWRVLVEDLLTLSKAFYFPIFNQELLSVLSSYLGSKFQMTEARGWKTIATKKNFHGWHNDAWYNSNIYSTPPRQLKLAVYLTDVSSGEFSYIKGTHLKLLKPVHMNDRQVDELGLPICNVKGPAGTIILFDTCGIHRQNTPVLDSRNALFYNFHDPSINLQALDVGYNRYSPLLLNSAFLKKLTSEQERILGFGDDRYYQEGSIKKERFHYTHNLMSILLKCNLELQQKFIEFNRLSNFVKSRIVGDE